MPIKGTQGNLQNELTYSKISSSYFEHPALSMFNDPRNGSLLRQQIKKWIIMDESKVRNDPKVTVLARLINGQPILAEKNLVREWLWFGEHQLTQIGQIFRHDQATFPFTQQITSYLSEKVLPPRTVDAGLTYNSLSKRE